MVQSVALVLTRNSTTHLYVAGLMDCTGNRPETCFSL